MNTAMPVVNLEVFEGPLDLLLHLIKRSEVEITDIPIALITDRYLAAIEGVDSLNLDGAGEYLVMAATLMLIKSRMLLPADEDPDAEVEADPRAELVQQLLEYQRYREVAVGLGDRPVLGRDVFRAAVQPMPVAPVEDGPPVRDASLGDLLAALKEVLARARTPSPHEIHRPGVSVAECVRRILARFALDAEVEFGGFFTADVTRTEIVVTFLAVLELMRLRVVRAVQRDHYGPILVRLVVADIATAVAMARDVGTDGDWGLGGGEERDGHA